MKIGVTLKDFGDNNEILGKGEGGGVQVIRNREGMHVTGQTAADYINVIYSEMGKCEEKMEDDWKEEYMNMDKIDQEFEFWFIELVEMYQLAKGIDIHKSSGFDGINSKILKDCLTICEYEITYLMNCSVQQKKFPAAWKKCTVTPIPKSGDKLNAENWRPINNLCVPGKLLEKCIYRQVEEYMEKNK